MKFRNGFVSNSSSSSFIIGFSQEPDTEYLKEALYNNEGLFPAQYQDEPFSTDVLIQHIMSELHGKTPIVDMEGIIKTIGDDASDWNNDPRYQWRVPEDQQLKEGTPEYEDACEKYDQKTIENALCMAKKIYDPSLIFYELSFADEDGSVGTELEHGCTWDTLPHLKFSHH